MSIRIMTNVWEHQGINATQKLVLLALADWANDEGLCWPSINRLAVKTGIAGRSVQRLIRQLEDLNLVRREEVTGKGNRYWLSIPMTECHPRHSVTPPLTQCHPTHDTVSPNTSYIHQDTSNDMSSEDDGLTVDEVVRAWNELADNKRLARVAKLTEGRKKQIKSLIREYDVDDWSTAMTAINNSKFLCGENERGWKANFDFLLQPKSFLKLIEGAYNNER